MTCSLPEDLRASTAALAEYWRTARALERELEAHVARYADAPRQHSDGWHAAKSTSVGGSEIAALLGSNPYSSRSKLLARKAGLDPFSSVGVACWWGTMMEPVSEQLVSALFGSAVIGTDIHVRSDALPAHANSPDGYTVVPFVECVDSDGQPDGWEMCFGVEAAVLAGRRVVPVPALVELKAPYRRHLKSSVPDYYRPQVLSGAALSPPAITGLFVEIVYRVCSLPQLEEHCRAYSSAYHNKDVRARTTAPPWGSPVALGVSAVYAPRMGTRRIRRSTDTMERKGADQACLEMLARACGMALAGDDLGVQLADLGDLTERFPGDFDALMSHVDSGEVRVQHSAPALVQFGAVDPSDPGGGQFTDGSAAAAVSAYMRAAEHAAPPEHYYLLGFLPWKVFDVGCHQVMKDPDYIETLRPHVDAFMRDLAVITSAPDRARAFAVMTASEAPSAAEILKNTGNEEALLGVFALHAGSTVRSAPGKPAPTR